MQRLFNYQGGGEGDVAGDAALSFAASDIDALLEQDDWTLVMLAKYGNLPPQWIERQDLHRQGQIIRVVMQMLKKQAEAIEEARARPTVAPSDGPDRWL